MTPCFLLGGETTRRRRVIGEQTAFYLNCDYTHQNAARKEGAKRAGFPGLPRWANLFRPYGAFCEEARRLARG
jgi:hypothetical protein